MNLWHTCRGSPQRHLYKHASHLPLLFQLVFGCAWVPETSSLACTCAPGCWASGFQRMHRQRPAGLRTHMHARYRKLLFWFLALPCVHTRELLFQFPYTVKDKFLTYRSSNNKGHLMQDFLLNDVTKNTHLWEKWWELTGLTGLVLIGLPYAAELKSK